MVNVVSNYEESILNFVSMILQRIILMFTGNNGNTKVYLGFLVLV